MQSRISSSDYSEFEKLIKHIKTYRVRYKLFKKWYLKLWWVTEKAVVLDYALRFHSFVSVKITISINGAINICNCSCI